MVFVHPEGAEDGEGDLSFLVPTSYSVQPMSTQESDVGKFSVTEHLQQRRLYLALSFDLSSFRES